MKIANIDTNDQIYVTIKEGRTEGMDTRIVKTMNDFISCTDDPRRDSLPQDHYDRFTIACADEIIGYFKEKEEHAKGDLDAYKWACNQMGMKEDFSVYC